MLEAVRVYARQQMPNYRKPASFLIKETYPLPPYSSVIGLIHTLCGWTGELNRGYRPMRVSIQGSYAGTVSDYATNYAFGAIPLDRTDLIVDAGNGKQVGIAKMPRSYELLTDVELLIHIIPEDAKLVRTIATALINPPIYPSLGRHEDLLQIEQVDIVELLPSSNYISFKYDAYLPIETAEKAGGINLTGTIYRLGKVFTYYGKKGIRIWKETVTARHVCAGNGIAPCEGVYIDNKYNDIVLPA